MSITSKFNDSYSKIDNEIPVTEDENPARFAQMSTEMEIRSQIDS